MLSTQSCRLQGSQTARFIAVAWFAGVSVGFVHADFLRGDANRDGTFNISDAITQVKVSLGAGRPLSCADAADANDDGRVNLADALTAIQYLLFDGVRPAYPGPFTTGPDLTCDPLDCADAEVSTPGVLLSEIMYQQRLTNSQSPAEFVELYNRTDVDIDLGGHLFTDGVRFAFPDGTVIPARDFLLVVRDADIPTWRREPAASKVVGSFEGTLSNGGERVTLNNGECLAETVRYDDRSPWPIGADGYAPSLERIDYTAPADDFHSWRTSLSRRIAVGRAGTAGVENTTLGTPTHPTLVAATLDPAQPRSTDEVALTVRLDGSGEAVTSVRLRWEGLVEDTVTEMQAVVMALGASNDEVTEFSATLPRRPSQSFVRWNLEVELHGRDSTIFLPHHGDEVPVRSYFVYDGEIPAKLPILWIFPPLDSGLLPEVLGRDLELAAVAIKEEGEMFPQFFDGTAVSRKLKSFGAVQGHNLKFLKGSEYRYDPSGDRSLNVLFERNAAELHTEHLGFQVYRDAGALAPWARWFRVLDYSPWAPEGEGHSQCLVFQQVNERFFKMNDLGSDGDLFKTIYGNFAKRNNEDTGRVNLNALFQALNPEDPESRRRGIFNQLDLESFRLYAAISLAISNWDGFHNNHFLYNELTPGSTWKIVPWDLDKVFDCPEFELTYPADGVSVCIQRPPNSLMIAYLSQPDLLELYLQTIRDLIGLGGAFHPETVFPKIDAFETLLLEDLELQEASMGNTREARRGQIVGSSANLRDRITARVASLRKLLQAE